MWPLAWFRFDEGIGTAEVYVFDETVGELVPMSLQDGIALARSKGGSLIAEAPAGNLHDIETCVIGKVTVPLRWERVPGQEGLDPIDERLWFEASCGGRDFLLEGGGHTFRGRMPAWCPAKEVSYRVSLAEMGAMSEEARYFVKG